MLFLPAVDIRNGVSLNQTDPSNLISKYVKAGAKWIHLVDLDRAYKTGNNDEVISELIAEHQVNFQLSGGIYDEKSLTSAIFKTPSRINLSADSIADVKFLETAFAKYGERLAISLDVKDGNVVPRGSNNQLGDYSKVLSQLLNLGATRFVITDVHGDSALSGPNVQLLQDVAEKCFAISPKIEIIASGGVSNYQDLITLKNLQLADQSILAGVIVGRALLDGLIDVEKSLQLLA